MIRPMGELILRDILLIFLVTVPVVLLLRLAHLPPIVGFILTGAIIGPSGLGLIHDPDRIRLLSEIGVTLLLFSIGLEFSFENFSKYKNYVLKGGFLQIVLCLVAGVVIGKILDWPLRQGLYFGCIISLSSTVVVLSSLMDRRMQESLSARVAIGVLILQDLAMIPMLVFLPALSLVQNPLEHWPLLVRQLGVLVLLCAAVFLIIRFCAGPLFCRISKA